MNMIRTLKQLGVMTAMALLANAASGAPIKALIIDGQNNHDWKATTPILKQILEETGLFAVDVATSPGTKKDMSTFKPNFAAYQVIVANYTGDAWPQETQATFVKYMRAGGGLVVFHAADNAFPEWKEWNEMIGVGGWGGRNEKSGPYLRLRDGKFVHDMTKGPGGNHGAQHAFVMEMHSPEHPINAGLPAKWMHAKDELYEKLRGPAVNLTVLASAYADPQTKGSGEQEPQLMAITFGQGRILHTAIGHGPEAMKCVGFAVTLQRGAEWAATGKVTQKVPANFPTAEQVSLRP